jgi:hypothetical protein
LASARRAPVAAFARNAETLALVRCVFALFAAVFVFFAAIVLPEVVSC